MLLHENGAAWFLGGEAKSWGRMSGTSTVVGNLQRYWWQFVADLRRSGLHGVQGSSVQGCNSSSQFCNETVLVLIYCKGQNGCIEMKNLEHLQLRVAMHTLGPVQA